jgi:hypothetical protein
MGETLRVRKGSHVRVVLRVRDPRGENRSPYAFDNPSLLQIGARQPLNRPELAQVDLIKGKITGYIEPTDPEYYNPLAPETTVIAKSWSGHELNGGYGGGFGGGYGGGFGGDFGFGGFGGKDEGGREQRLQYQFRAWDSSYVRARGSNIPAGTPNERDAYGNPLPDNLSDNIACSDPACPPHINGILDADVEAWADVWFHANPIFIEVY